MTGPLRRLFDRVVNAGTEGLPADLVQSLRIANGFSTIGVVMTVFLGFRNVVRGFPFSAVTEFAMAATIVASLYLFRSEPSRRRYLLASNVAVASIALGIAFLSLLAGPDGAPILFWLTVPPLVAALFVPVRAAAAWAAVCVALAAIVILAPDILPLPVENAFTTTENIVITCGLVITAAALALLARTVTDRTIATADERGDAMARQAAELAAAKNALAEAQRAKDLYVAQVSHELRSPLTGVISLVQLLEENRRLPETARDDVVLIGDTAGAMLSIVNDLLDHAKLEAGRMTLEAVAMPVRATTDASVALVAERVRAKGLAFSVDYGVDDDLTVLADPLRWRQVLDNLLSNAVKFTDEGGISVAVVECEPEGADPDGHVRLRTEVTDTGIGVDPARAADLFSPYAQADAGTSRRYGGTGLGLAVCAELVALMDGAISVAPADGGGSVFSFEVTLPRA